MNNRVRALVGIGAAAVASASAAQVTTTFDNGTEGWSVSGRTDISQDGNPGANLDVLLLDVFGASVRNTTNADFLGDYTTSDSFEMSIDVRTHNIDFFGQQVVRDFIIELRDDTNDQGYPYTSVWLNLGLLDASAKGDNGDGWVTYTFTVENTHAQDLPEGWGGYGYEDPKTFEPMLPPGRTFESVLASVDEITFTTFVPGFFFGFTNFELQVDNITLTPLDSDCVADVNGDGSLTPTDFTAWVSAFNNNQPECDQNGDGSCTPTDFTAWVTNYNAGC